MAARGALASRVKTFMDSPTGPRTVRTARCAWPAPSNTRSPSYPTRDCAGARSRAPAAQVHFWGPVANWGFVIAVRFVAASLMRAHSALRASPARCHA